MLTLSPPPEPTTSRIAPPPDYSARSVHWRLMVVVAIGMTALLALRWVFPEESWRWIVGGQPTQSVELEPAEWANKSPDTRVARTAPQDKTDIPDAFILPLPKAAPAQAAAPATPANEAKAESPAAPAPLPTLTPAQAKMVQDDTVYRAEEQDAWFTLLAGLHRATAEQVAKGSEGRVGFVQLYEQPTYYRGRLVTVRGTIHQAKWVYSHENKEGIRGYFHCWLMPAGGPTSPIQIYLLDLPDDFPRGDNLREEVEIHGYFFKRVAYAAKDTTRLAPVILAKSPVWTPPAARPAPLPPNYQALAVIFGLTFLVGVGAAWYMFRATPEPAPSGSPFAAHNQLSPEEEERNVRAALDQLSRRI